MVSALRIGGDCFVLGLDRRAQFFDIDHRPRRLVQESPPFSGAAAR
jgi:hypothetical protein